MIKTKLVHVFRGQGPGQGHDVRGQGQGQGHDQLSSRRLEAKAMASRTPSLIIKCYVERVCDIKCRTYYVCVLLIT